MNLVEFKPFKSGSCLINTPGSIYYVSAYAYLTVAARVDTFTLVCAVLFTTVIPFRGNVQLRTRTKQIYNKIITPGVR